MRSLRYLNSILTVIAVLLTLNLYVAWNTAPGAELLGSSEAYAQEAGGIPNAGSQRKEMIDLLKQLNTHLAGVKKSIDQGVRVNVTNDDAK